MATFPVLKTQDLMQSMADVGYPLSAEDIDRPLSSKVIPLYFFFWNNMTGIPLEEVKMAAQVYIERMHEEGIPPAEIDSLAENIHIGVLYETL
jgi:hypothetical protein